MKPLPILSAALSAAALVACVFTIACETESAGGGGAISISPSEATLGIGQSITLKARGAETYAWSLESTNEIGRLSNNTGSTTTYTALSGVGEDQIVRVSASTTASSSSTSYSSDTNETQRATSQTVSTTIIIHHR